MTHPSYKERQMEVEHAEVSDEARSFVIAILNEAQPRTMDELQLCSWYATVMFDVETNFLWYPLLSYVTSPGLQKVAEDVCRTCKQGSFSERVEQEIKEWNDDVETSPEHEQIASMTAADLRNVSLEDIYEWVGTTAEWRNGSRDKPMDAENVGSPPWQGVSEI